MAVKEKWKTIELDLIYESVVEMYLNEENKNIRSISHKVFDRNGIEVINVDDPSNTYNRLYTKAENPANNINNIEE